MDHLDEKHLSRLADMAESLKFTKLGGKSDDGEEKPQAKLSLPKGVFPKSASSGDQFILVSLVKVGEAGEDEISAEIQEAASVDIPKEKPKREREDEGDEDEEEEDGNRKESEFMKAMKG